MHLLQAPWGQILEETARALGPQIVKRVAERREASRQQSGSKVSTALRMPRGIDIPLTTQLLRSNQLDPLGTALLQADLCGARMDEERSVRFWPLQAPDEGAQCRVCKTAMDHACHCFECDGLATIQAMHPRAIDIYARWTAAADVKGKEDMRAKYATLLT